jgi:hypothetical protein
LCFAITFFSFSVLAQEKTGFAINPNIKNIAGLFTMTNENGRLENLRLMENVFKDGSLGFSVEKHHNVSSQFIYKAISDMASRTQEDGTLLLYFNSHGGGSGNNFGMTSSTGSFRFSKAIESIAKSKKIRRVIMLIDTCHAAGAIQEGLKQNGELLRNIKNATPTSFLPEMPNKYNSRLLPFISIFNVKNDELDFGQDADAYDEILIISSSSVEDLSTRGVFASRLSRTFENVKGNNNIKVQDFLKKFADSHSSSGQQPYYKVMPNKNMLDELLFGPFLSQMIPISDHSRNDKKYDQNFIPMPIL